MVLENKIGTYEIIEQIGSGGMATVYKAHQPKLDRYVAIKVMHQNFSQDKNFLARFEREARIVARLDHPNIVPVYDYDEYENQPYLVMKYIDGRTLKDILLERRLSTNETVTIMTAMADALNYAHQQGILHRDVKPSNIIVDSRGTPYLTDFGLARIAQMGESTMSGDTMLGTPHYISPEQAQGSLDLDARTDVYSLGVVLYELVTGTVPFKADSSYAIIHSHIYTPPPLPSQVNPDVNSAVEAVILKALAKQPEDRYPTPVDMIADFRQALTTPQAKPTARKQVVQPAHQSKDNPPNGRVVIIPSSPKPPPPPGHIPSPRSDVEQELKAAGEEIKKAFKDVGEEWKKAWKGNRYMWRPGAKWTTDPHGNQGFFTDEELQEIEGSLDEDEIIRQRVEKRLKARQEFYTHLMAYLSSNALMIFIWFMTGANGYFWPMWVIGPWGFGLIMHYFSYYNEHGSGRFRQEQAMHREIERERERYYSTSQIEKSKNSFSDDSLRAPKIRLTEDGEFTDSFVDELDNQEKRKNR